MDSIKFNEIVKNRIDLINSVLVSKGKEYANDDDRFINFRDGARMTRSSPEEVLWFYMTKHTVSVKKIIDEVDSNLASKELIQEKIGDMINYLILLEGMLYERHKEI